MIVLVIRKGQTTAGGDRISDDPVVDVYVNVDGFRSYETMRHLVTHVHERSGCYGITRHQKEAFLPVECGIEMFDDALGSEALDRLDALTSRKRAVLAQVLLGNALGTITSPTYVRTDIS